MELKKEFGYAILFDCHSIKRNVPTISKDPFPDLILGDNDSNSANTILSEVALKTLSKDMLFEVTHNHPFKGGHIVCSTITKGRTTEARGEVKCNLLTTATYSIRLFINPSCRCRGPRASACSLFAGLMV